VGGANNSPNATVL